MTPIRILIADDHPLYRAGLRVLLDAQPDIQVVGEVARGDEVAALVEQTSPDIVLMDVSMPGMDGIEATRRLTALAAEVAVLILSMLDDSASVADAITAGARGYLVKGASGDDALRAIRAVANGEIIFGSGIATQALSRMNSARRACAAPFSDLTERELDILRLVARGYTNTAIAEQLHLGSQTVRNYVSSILRKMQVTTRIEAALSAREAGLD